MFPGAGLAGRLEFSMRRSTPFGGAGLPPLMLSVSSGRGRRGGFPPFADQVEIQWISVRANSH